MIKVLNKDWGKRERGTENASGDVSENASRNALRNTLGNDSIIALGIASGNTLRNIEGYFGGDNSNVFIKKLPQYHRI